MSSPSSYSVPRSATYDSSRILPSMYRQTDYHDEKGIRTIESRRHSPVISAIKSTQKVHSSSPASRDHETTSSSRSSKASSQSSRRRSSSSGGRTQLDRKDHVMPRPVVPLRSRPQVVIMQGPVSVSIKFKNSNKMPSRFNTGLSTPPPTPKLGRLATPELDDIDDSPFCDCCAGTRVLKYCAGCGCKFDSWGN